MSHLLSSQAVYILPKGRAMPFFFLKTFEFVVWKAQPKSETQRTHASFPNNMYWDDDVDFSK